MKDADGKEHSEVAMGSGPVDALYQAISAATKLNNRLLEFTIGSVTDGTKALGAVTVRVGAPEEDDQAQLDENLKHNAQTGLRRVLSQWRFVVCAVPCVWHGSAFCLVVLRDT
jgi:2-isopropylmalate synthase